LDYLTTHTSRSPIRRGFAHGLNVNYKNCALDLQPKMIKFTSCLPMVGGSLQVFRLPPYKHVVIISIYYFTYRSTPQTGGLEHGYLFRCKECGLVLYILYFILEFTYYRLSLVKHLMNISCLHVCTGLKPNIYNYNIILTTIML
jgi:hypothetical protein